MFYPVGEEASPKNFKLPPMYSCDCTVVVIVLTCGLIASPQAGRTLIIVMITTIAATSYQLLRLFISIMHRFKAQGCHICGAVDHKRRNCPKKDERHKVPTVEKQKQLRHRKKSRETHNDSRISKKRKVMID